MSNQIQASASVSDIAKNVLQKVNIQKMIDDGLSAFMDATKGMTPSQAVVASSMVLGATCAIVRATGVARKVTLYAVERGQAVEWKLGPLSFSTTTPSTAA